MSKEGSIQIRKKHPPVSENPSLLEEWDFSKNIGIDPAKVTQGSPLKVWWRCSKGHLWEARVNTRLIYRCPHCVGKGILKSGNILWSRSDVKKYWSKEKNIGIDPEKIGKKSKLQVWCKCPDCSSEWQQIAVNKMSCKACSKKELAQKTSLLALYPDLAEEWDYEKNAPLTPQEIFGRSKSKAWWLCPNGHSYQSTIVQRATRNSGCLVCLGRRSDGLKSLFSEYPKLISEWSFKKNLDINPTELSPNSNKKVWWVCSQGHEWERQINIRIKKSDSGCPFCSLSKADELNNLAVTHPHLAKEWDYEKNRNLNINSVTAIKNVKAWWKCSKGHEWNAVIATRANGARCPYCVGRLATEESNLQVEFPLIAHQWHPIKNQGKLPNQFRPKSSQKAWWLCDRGHEWEASISSRTSGSGCPVCKPSTSKAEIRVYTEMKGLFPDAEWRADYHGKEIDVYVPSIRLAIEIDGYVWHLNKVKSDLEKNRFLNSHGLTIIRIRDSKLPPLGGHEYGFNSSSLDEGAWFDFIKWLLKRVDFDKDSKLRIRTYLSVGKLTNDEFFKTIISRLPSPLKESSIEALHPQLITEWDFEANLPFTPDMFTSGSGEKVWWRCSNDHAWKATINSRVNGHSCPYCGKGDGKRRLASPDYNLALVNPTLSAEWSEKNDKSPVEVSPNSSYKALWHCSKGHTWNATVASRNRGNGCPYCGGRKLSEDNSLQANSPELVKEWNYDRNDKNPSDIMQRSNYKAWWKCSNCDHEWQARVYSRVQGRGCIRCSYANGRRKLR